MNMQSEIKALAQSSAAEIVAIRRHIHAHPELSFQEHNTVKYVAEMLLQTGITHTREMAGTGLVALIEGKNPGAKTIALRADMDALPIEEKNEVPYRSQQPGIMHACGHDVHTASLLGTAKILQSLSGRFEGTVKLIFQPGEEKAPGGASLMIKEGVLENPKPSHVIGQHVMPLIPVGKVGFKPGLYMASADELYITVHGSGGHAAMPDKIIDPVLIASHLIVALQQIVSRHATPTIPSVLSFGKVSANGATNIIPDEVRIEGTFRTLNETWRAEAHRKMKKLAEGLAEAMGGSCDFHIMDGYPFLYNNEPLTRRMRECAEAYLGQENVLDLDTWMAAEDFAFYSQAADACFYRLGVRNEEKGIVSGVHTPTFNIDENALEIGAGLMAWLAINELGFLE
jgi:amidohydrolase